MSRGVILPVLIGIIFLGSFGLIQDADAATQTFTVDTTITSDTTISSGETWTINSDVTLTIDIGVTIDNSGTIDNFGFIDSRGYFINSGIIINSGSIDIDIVNALDNYGTIINSGSINIWDSSFLHNFGTIDNSGTILNNLSTINNPGTIDNSGTIDNFGTIDNSGTINTSGTLTNAGTIGIFSTGFLNNSGPFTNTGSINNSGTLTNSNVINNAGSLRSDGIIDNLSGGFINNNDTIDNLSSGTINNSGLIANPTGSTINNSGFIDNSGGTIDNSGILNNDCTGIISGTITGNQPVDTCDSDVDSDGFTITNGDCNDNDFTVYPGAIELVDGQDNDCNGVIPSNEIDNDGDGYIEAIIDAGGWDGSPDIQGGDCNDSDNSTYPGAAEIFGDGIDNNCTSGIDEGFTDTDGDGYVVETVNVLDGFVDCNDSDPLVLGETTFYGDADGDGYGDPASGSILACFAPVGFALDSSDCDDTDNSIYPGATEILDDGIDQDCDGLDSQDTSNNDTLSMILAAIIEAKTMILDSINSLDTKVDQVSQKIDNIETGSGGSSGGIERVSVTVNMPHVTMNPGELFVLLDTTGSGTLEKVHVAANLPCSSSNEPKLSIVAGVAGGSLEPVINSSSEFTGFMGPKKTCTFHNTILASDVPGGEITDVILINDGDKKSKLPKWSVVTITGTYAP